MNQMFTYRNKDGVEYMTAPLLENDLLVHAFTTRKGGESEGSLSSLNLGLGRGDDPVHVAGNYRRICGVLNVDETLCIMAKQIHSTKVQVVTMEDAGKGIRYPDQRMEVDGLVTNQTGLPLVVFYADCVPILLYHEKTHCMAAVHAGWRGSVGGIAGEAVRIMQKQFGAVPAEILAAVGPSIGPCHFEVGMEVAEEFCRRGFQDMVSKLKKSEEKAYVDLWRSNRAVLERAGLKPEHIQVAQACTVCDTETFFSHRGDGPETGRMALIAALR